MFGKFKDLFVIICLALLLQVPRNCYAEISKTGVWNGFLGQVNIVECVNTSNKPVTVTLSLLKNDHSALASIPFNLASFATQHIVLNDFPIQDSYGTYLVLFENDSDVVNCQTSFYKINPPTAEKEVQFAFAIPAGELLVGESAGLFNSMNPEPNLGPVANWLSIYNPNNSAFSGEVFLYSMDGSPMGNAKFRFSLNAGQRNDFALGHPQGQIVGMYRIVPDQSQANYGAFLSRFSGKQNEYNYAFPLLAKNGRNLVGPIPASTMGNATNWAEIANIGSVSERVTLEVFSRNGQILSTKAATLPAYAQAHFYLNSVIGENSIGSFRVRADSNNAKLISQSLFYGRNSLQSEHIAWAYASQADENISAKTQFVAPINTYLGASNWLKAFNFSSSAVATSVALHLAGGENISNSSLPLSILSGADFPVHERTGPNKIGLALLQVSGSAALSGELVRVFPNKNGGIGYIMNSKLRSAPSGSNPSSGGSSSSSSSSSSGSNSSGPAVCGNNECELGERYNFCPTDCVNPTQLKAEVIVDEHDWYKTNYAPQPLTSGFVPLPVFFEGWQSFPRDEIVEYQWDFGDGSARFNGFNAAHVFETPGLFTVSLRVKNSSGKWSEAKTIDITANARAGVSYYVDSVNGNDSFSGTKAKPWKTATRVFEKLTRYNGEAPYNPGDSIYFKRGQTFQLSRLFSYGHNLGHSILFSADPQSTGAKPVIQYTGTQSGAMLGLLTKFGHLSFVDLVFNFRSTDSSKVMADGLLKGGTSRNLLFLRVEANDPQNGFFQLNGSAGTPHPSGVFLIDSKIHNETTFARSTIQIWGLMGRVALIGNTFDKAGNHNAYLSHINKGIIANNVFSRPASGRDALRISGGYDEQDNSVFTNNVHVLDNYFIGWKDPIACIGSTCDCSLAPEIDICDPTHTDAHSRDGNHYNWVLVEIAPNKTTQQSIESVLFENNVLTNFERGMVISAAEDITVRNNLLISPSTAAGSFVSLAPRFNSRPLKNVNIAGNTMVRATTKQSQAIEGNIYTQSPYNGQTQHQNIAISNNIFAGISGSMLAVQLDSQDPAFLNEFSFHNNLYYFPGNSAPFCLTPFISCEERDANGVLIASHGIAFSAWKAQGFDTEGLNVDPQFVGPLIFFNHSSGQPASLEDGFIEALTYQSRFKLKNTSPAISKGKPLNSVLYYDFERRVRGANGSYDIGALEVN